jgi:hypothetical protein
MNMSIHLCMSQDFYEHMKNNHLNSSIKEKHFRLTWFYTCLSIQLHFNQPNLHYRNMELVYPYFALFHL